MPAVPQQPEIRRELKELSRRLAELETGRRLNNSAITDALIAVDSDGVEQARFGLLPDGSYGMWGNIENTSARGVPVGSSDTTLIALSKAPASGSTSAVMTGSVLTTDTTYTPPVIVPPADWTVDPTISVAVNVTGSQLLVIVSAKLALGDTGRVGMSVSLAGPTPAGYDRDHALSITGPVGTGAQSSYQWLFTGLTPGAYTVTPGYFLDGTSGSASFRSLIVQPY